MSSSSQPVSAYLAPARAVVFPEEHAECSLVLSNPGSDEIPLATDVWIKALVKIASPRGEVYEIHPFANSAELEHGSVLYAGAEPEKSFTLDQWIAGFGPGIWSLGATCSLNGSLLKTRLVKITVAGPGPVTIALPSPMDDTPGPVGEFWMIRQGAGVTLLSTRRLISPDRSVGRGWEVLGLDRRAVIEANTQGFTACANDSNGLRDRRWIGWISSDAVCFGVTAWDFETCRLPVAADVGQFISRLQVRDDGGVDAFVLSKDAATLSLIRVAPPVWRLDEESIETSQGEDESQPWVPPVTLTNPELVARHSLPIQPTHSACARFPTPNGELSAVALAVNSEENIELHLLILNGRGEMIRSGDYRIGNAALIRGGNPTLAVDQDGRSRLTVLHTSNQGSVLLRTRIAFGLDAIPLMMEGSGREHLCHLPSPVEEGTIVDSGEPDRWASAWCVTTRSGHILRGPSNGPTESLALPEGLINPIAAVADRHNVGVAVQEPSGTLVFL